MATPTERDPLLPRPDEDGPSPNLEAGGYESRSYGGSDPDPDPAQSLPDDVPLVKDPSLKELLLIMVPTWVGVFFSALDVTIIATLLGPISSEFKSLPLLSWLASAYLIANAACQPLAGRLTDIFSRRTGLILANVFFAAGCLICGLARNEWVMIVGRVVSGLGGGGINTISTFVSSDLVPLRSRGVWQGFGNIMFGFGMGMGGFVGGWINDSLGWRWAFLLQVPFLVVSGVLVSIFVNIPVKETSEAAWKRVDFRGAILLTSSLVLLLLGVNAGGNQLPWTSPFILTVIPLSAVTLGLFIYAEDKLTAEPIIPVRLFLRRTVSAACLTNVFCSMSMIIVFFYVPLYLQVGGHSSEATGRRLIPNAVATSLGSICAGLMMRLTGRYYLMNCVAMIVYISGAVLVSSLTFSSPAWETYVYLVPGGFAFGSMLTVTLVALIAAVDHTDQAVITSASYAFRSTGTTTGVAIGSAVFQNRLGPALREAFRHVPDAEVIIQRLRDDYHVLEKLHPAALRQRAMDAYMMAFQATFYTALGLAVMGAAMSLFMKEHVLYKNMARK